MMIIDNVQESVRKAAERLRFWSLRKILSPNGTATCKCGRRISANKATCLACSQVEEPVEVSL